MKMCKWFWYGTFKCWLTDHITASDFSRLSQFKFQLTRGSFRRCGKIWGWGGSNDPADLAKRCSLIHRSCESRLCRSCEISCKNIIDMLTDSPHASLFFFFFFLRPANEAQEQRHLSDVITRRLNSEEDCIFSDGASLLRWQCVLNYSPPGVILKCPYFI